MEERVGERGNRRDGEGNQGDGDRLERREVRRSPSPRPTPWSAARTCPPQGGGRRRRRRPKLRRSPPCGELSPKATEGSVVGSVRPRTHFLLISCSRRRRPLPPSQAGFTPAVSERKRAWPERATRSAQTPPPSQGRFTRPVSEKKRAWPERATRSARTPPPSQGRFTRPVSEKKRAWPERATRSAQTPPPSQGRFTRPVSEKKRAWPERATRSAQESGPERGGRTVAGPIQGLDSDSSGLVRTAAGGRSGRSRGSPASNRMTRSTRDEGRILDGKGKRFVRSPRQPRATKGRS
jgi:hypothetical protein